MKFVGGILGNIDVGFSCHYEHDPNVIGALDEFCLRYAFDLKEFEDNK